VATTEHFEIAYPARLDSIAARAAPIAETTYDPLSAGLGVTVDERIRVYLTDQDGLPFGFATSLGYANIWVHPNDTAPRPRRCRRCSTASQALFGSSLCGAGLRGVFAQLPADRLLRKSGLLRQSEKGLPIPVLFHRIRCLCLDGPRLSLVRFDRSDRDGEEAFPVLGSAFSRRCAEYSKPPMRSRT
jgi:hypothetical protein